MSKSSKTLTNLKNSIENVLKLRCIYYILHQYDSFLDTIASATPVVQYQQAPAPVPYQQQQQQPLQFLPPGQGPQAQPATIFLDGKPCEWCGAGIREAMSLRTLGG